MSNPKYTTEFNEAVRVCEGLILFTVFLLIHDSLRHDASLFNGPAADWLMTSCIGWCIGIIAWVRIKQWLRDFLNR